MGRYTVNDNRSMQMNPNNERYWSSRRDDYDELEEDGYDYDPWSYKESLIKDLCIKEREYLETIGFDICGKRLMFKCKNDYKDPLSPVSLVRINKSYEKNNDIRRRVLGFDSEVMLVAVNKNSLFNFLNRNLNTSEIMGNGALRELYSKFRIPNYCEFSKRERYYNRTSYISMSLVKFKDCFLFEFDFENITAASLLTLPSLRKYLYWEKDFIGNEDNVFDNFEDIISVNN